MQLFTEQQQKIRGLKLNSTKFVAFIIHYSSPSNEPLPHCSRVCLTLSCRNVVSSLSNITLSTHTLYPPVVTSDTTSCLAVISWWGNCFRKSVYWHTCLIIISLVTTQYIPGIAFFSSFPLYHAVQTWWSLVLHHHWHHVAGGSPMMQYLTCMTQSLTVVAQPCTVATVLCLKSWLVWGVLDTLRWT